MPDLSPQIAADVAAACKAGAAEAADSLKRNLGADVGLAVGQPGQIATIDSLPAGCSGPGLVVALMRGASGALFVLPTSTGLVPDWCAKPDATGQSKLATLAQELGMVLLPERYAPDGFRAALVENVREALARGVRGEAAVVPLVLERPGGQKAAAYLIWPVANPGAVFGPSSAQLESPTTPGPSPGKSLFGDSLADKQPEPTPSTPAPETNASAPGSGRPMRTDKLPSYTRSLLRIRVPVVVTLAQKRQRLGSIVELGPGSIIQFDKSCEEMLDLEAGGRNIATGEAVKVGDKFGLRITSITLPEERFKPVKK